MKCTNCGAAFSTASIARVLTCAFCGATRANPAAQEPRALDALLDQVFAEQKSDAFELKVQATVSRSSTTICDVDGRHYESVADAPPEVQQALRESKEALREIFGDSGILTPSSVSTAVVEETRTAPRTEPDFFEVAAPVRSARSASAITEVPHPHPRIVLGSEPDENPEWTRYLIPVLVAAVLGGVGVAAVMALVLG